LIQAMDVAQLFACLLDPALPVLLKPADAEAAVTLPEFEREAA
jgi:hypothetical protein